MLILVLRSSDTVFNYLLMHMLIVILRCGDCCTTQVLDAIRRCPAHPIPRGTEPSPQML